MTNMFSFLNYFPIISAELIFKICISLIIIITTRMVIKGLIPVVSNFCQKNNFDQHSCLMMHKLTRGLITLIGATIVMQNLGIEVSMLIAAFGITGIVLSYGMKDIVANFIASIFILGYKHIKINDYINIKDWQGQVIDINLRHTTLQNNNEIIFVPNLVLYTQPFSIIKK
jgi:small-conductance mechanosensitive channel